MANASTPDEKGPEFRHFLLAEYNNIAEAHFTTINTIAHFFQQYLTIIAIPITVLVIIFNLDRVEPSLSNAITSATPILGLLSLVISIVGLMIMWHILNLRLDALLYARSVNGIRKYFYDREDQLSLHLKTKFRVLPQSPLLPVFREFRFFGPVVFTFAILDSVYFYFAAIAFWFASGVPNPFVDILVMVVTSVFFTSHLALYFSLTNYREFGYMRSSVVGVDIDGVLNLHESQFSQFLQKNAGKQLDETQITAIPIHDDANLGITVDDEEVVFNDPQYWISMPAMQDAADILGKFRNLMGLKVHIFTRRSWPTTLDRPPTQAKQIRSNWSRQSRAYTRTVHLGKPWLWRITSPFRSLRRALPYQMQRFLGLVRRDTPIDRITKDWLEQHDFEYDAIMIEKEGGDVVDPAGHIHNRFYACRNAPIRYFVEDDHITAEKLAFICDVVFLIDHPYNQSDQLPNNVIRVRSWKEIYHHLRQLW